MYLVQRSTSVLIPSKWKVCGWALSHFSLFLSMTLIHFRWNLISSDSFANQNTLIHQLLTTTQLYSQWPPRTRIMNSSCSLSSQSLHQFVKFPLSQTVIAILNSCSSLNFITYQICDFRCRITDSYFPLVEWPC